MFSTSFCAVPAFMRVEPAMTSGPTTGTIEISAALVIADPGTQVIAIVKRAGVSGIAHGADCIGRASRSRNSHQRIRRYKTALLEDLWGRLLRHLPKLRLPGSRLHSRRRLLPGRDPEKRQKSADTRSIQHSQPSRRTGANIEETPAGLKPFHNFIDRLRHCGQNAPDGRGHTRVFFVHQTQNVFRWQGARFARCADFPVQLAGWNRMRRAL